MVNSEKACAPVFRPIGFGATTIAMFTSQVGDFAGGGEREVFNPINSRWVFNAYSGSLSLRVAGVGGSLSLATLSDLLGGAARFAVEGGALVVSVDSGVRDAGLASAWKAGIDRLALHVAAEDVQPGAGGGGFEDEPDQREPLHPHAGGGDRLTHEEQPVVAYAEGGEGPLRRSGHR